MFKYQEEFAQKLTALWEQGYKADVRTKIRNSKNKAQASFLASYITSELVSGSGGIRAADEFLFFIHPNQK